MEKVKKFSNKPAKLKTDGGSDRTPMIPYSELRSALANIKPTEVTEGRSCGIPTLTLKYDHVETPYGNINGVFYAINIDKYDEEVMYTGDKPKSFQRKILELSNKASKFYRIMNSKIEGTITINGFTEELKHIDVDVLEYAGSVHRPEL